MKILFAAAALSVSASALTAASLAPSNLPPAGIPVEKTPQFIFLGSDDNFGQGMPVILDYLDKKKNPAGTGQKATYDGDPVRMSFYSNTCYKTTQWLSWHKRALAAGHELGLHTDGHPHINSDQTADEEIAKNIKLMTTADKWETNAVVFDSSVFTGFRSPYLDVSSSVFKALKKHGLRYDCSIEEGMAPGVEVKDFPWPYTLDGGATPGIRHLYENKFIRDTIGSHPGIWEIPAYPLMFIPDSLQKAYGVGAEYDDGKPFHDTYPNGEANESVDGKKMTGLDYDAWYPQKWSGHELAATLLYNLKLRLASNRVPFAFGVHSQYYDNAERMAGIKEFIDSALAYPDVRFVTGNQLIDWMENPTALAGKSGGTAVKSVPVSPGAAFSASKGKLVFHGAGRAEYRIALPCGRVVASGTAAAGESVDLSGIRGVHIVQYVHAGKTAVQKLLF